jgi:hypothetical protein
MKELKPPNFFLSIAAAQNTGLKKVTVRHPSTLGNLTKVAMNILA